MSPPTREAQVMTKSIQRAHRVGYALAHYTGTTVRVVTCVCALAVVHCTSGPGQDSSAPFADPAPQEPVATVSQALNSLPVYRDPSGSQTIFQDSGTVLTVQGNISVAGPNPWADITAFGATTSSSCTQASGASNSTAISKAISSLSNGGTLFIPPGSYCVGSPILLSSSFGSNYPHINVVGAGKSSILMGPSNANIGYIIQISGSFNTVRDLQIQCTGGLQATSGIGFAPSGTSVQIQANTVAHIYFQNCTWNLPSDAISMNTGSGTNTGNVTENVIDDIFIYNANNANSGGNGVHMFIGNSGYLTDNHVSNITVADTPTTTGINLGAGANANVFANLVMDSGSLDGGAASFIYVASGATNNQFHAVRFDDDGYAAISDITNNEPTTQLIGTTTNAYKIAGTAAGSMTIVGSAGGTTQVGGYSYTQTTGSATLNAPYGTNVPSNLTLTLNGPTAVGEPPGLVVGAPIPNTGYNGRVATFAAPDAGNYGPAVQVGADPEERGVFVYTMGFNYSNNTGFVNMVDPEGLATQSANGNWAPMYLYASQVAVENGGGLVLKGSDGKCVGLTESGGALVTTNNVSCP
jgi:hypothetical protein